MSTYEQFKRLGYSEEYCDELVELLGSLPCDPDCMKENEMSTVYKTLYEAFKNYINDQIEGYLLGKYDHLQAFEMPLNDNVLNEVKKPIYYFENGNQIIIREPEVFDMDTILRGKGEDNIWEIKIGDDTDED